MSARGTHPTNELTAASAQDSNPESRFNLSKDTQASFNSLELYRGFSDLPKHSDQGSATLPRVDVMDTGNSLKREPIILAQAQERGSSRDFQGDRPSQTKPEGEAPARAWEMNLKHNSDRHGHPDALVYLPRGFDPGKPVNLMIYNHGWNTTAGKSYRDAKLGEQMAGAPANTVLIVPEWQQSPGAESGRQGNLSKPGMYAGMLQEILDKTPGLQGKKLKDIENIGIISHSAGYNPTEKMLADGTLGPKVKSLTLLDSAYNPAGMEGWLRANAPALARGEKRFTNIFNDTTGESQMQLKTIKAILGERGLPQEGLLVDQGNAKRPLQPEQLANKSIVFKRSDVTDGKQGPHGSMPGLYVKTIASSLR